MPSKEEMREASTQKIMETALELFAVQGFHSTSMNKIAQKAGVSKGLIYNYYESKYALLFAIVAYALEVGKSIMELPKKEISPKESLEKIIRISFMTLRQEAHYWKLMTELMLQEDVMQKVKKLLTDNMKASFRQIDALFSAMGSSTPMMETRMLVATLDGIALHYLFGLEEYPLEEMEKRVIQQFVVNHSQP